MRIRGLIIVTFSLVFAVSALIFHMFAMFSKRWVVAIPRHPRSPNDQTHYYGLWTRCQYSNTSFVIPDISSQPNIENFVCRPNTYLRYDIYNEEITKNCYASRHQCSSIIGVHPDCQCKYLSVTVVQQWCSILATVFLLLAILVFYLKVITTTEDAIMARILIFAPTVLLTLALISMITTMILLAAYLRRNEYEDYDIRIPKQTLSPVHMNPETVNFYRLNAFFKIHQDPIIQGRAISLFKSIHKERFRARIDWSAAGEILAIILTLVAYVLSIFLTLKQVR